MKLPGVVLCPKRGSGEYQHDEQHGPEILGGHNPVPPGVLQTALLWTGDGATRKHKMHTPMADCNCQKPQYAVLKSPLYSLVMRPCRTVTEHRQLVRSPHKTSATTTTSSPGPIVAFGAITYTTASSQPAKKTHARRKNRCCAIAPPAPESNQECKWRTWVAATALRPIFWQGNIP